MYLQEGNTITVLYVHFVFLRVLLFLSCKYSHKDEINVFSEITVTIPKCRGWCTRSLVPNTGGGQNSRGGRESQTLPGSQH